MRHNIVLPYGWQKGAAMFENIVAGLVITSFVVTLLWVNFSKGKSGRVAQDGAGPGYRPHVQYAGALREVVRRKAQSDGQVACTLRPDTKGAPRPQLTVSKDSILWVKKKF
jgi:hypothetical protein